MSRCISQTDCQLIFDFDGVLIDSREESRANAFNTAIRTGGLASVPEYQQTLFELNRVHVRSAGELVCLAEWCLAQPDVQQQAMSVAEFQQAFSSWHDLDTKKKAFFEQRILLQKQLGSDWYLLQKPFEPIWSFAKRIVNQLLIVTHKNQQAVLSLASHYGLGITAQQIFSGDAAADKFENFQRLFAEYPAKEYYFVDDNFRNLADLKHKLDDARKVSLFYASWGYGSLETQETARNLGIQVCNQEELIRKFEDGKLGKGCHAK